MDEIKTVDRHSIGAFIVIIVARKVTTLQVAPGQLLVEHNVRQIEGLLMNYKEVTNNILVDQVLHWDPQLSQLFRQPRWLVRKGKEKSKEVGG